MRMLINIDVPDLTPAIKFYTEALSLRLNRILDDDVAELTGGSSMFYLLQNNADTPATDSAEITRQYHRHWTPVHIDFVVDDLAKAVHRAVAAGAIMESERVEWRGSRCISFSDPFGHGFCLIEFDRNTYVDESESQ
jgi:predicted enzyme related to lactoylglutathione lyase